MDDDNFGEGRGNGAGDTNKKSLNFDKKAGGGELSPIFLGSSGTDGFR